MAYNPYSLEGKTILVTGASSGIGASTAIEISRLGGTVILTGRNLSRLRETLNRLEGKDHRLFAADLTSEEDIHALCKDLSTIDGMVLSVGINEIVPVMFSSPKKMIKVFEHNFFGPAELLRQVLKKKKLNEGGSIVALSSIGGVTFTSYANGIYGASKAALTSWMKFVAQEVATKGIRANCVCPGMTETPFIHSGTITEKQLEEDKNQYPLQRYGNPEEIAWAIIFLLSDASKWITGTSLVIDGGISI